MQYQIPSHKQLAEKARALVLADLSCYDSVPGLAKRTGTNAYTLKKAFRELYGESVFNFSRRVRIEEAKRLLGETNYTLQTIADLVGYSEGNNFQVAFKTVAGCTPGEWRRRQSQQ